MKLTCPKPHSHSWWVQMVLEKVLFLLYWKKYYSIKTVKILRKPILLTVMLIRVTISVLAFLLIATIMLSLLAVGQILNVD